YLAGAAFAYSLATRPLSTLAMGTAIALTAPMLSSRRATPAMFALINLRAVAGAAPIAILLFAYNTYFFGGPLRTGYDLAMGPDMSLGMHRDPWGNLYGLREAIGYTAGDLLGLAIHLLETPLPAVPLIGLFLLIAKRLEPGARLLAAWAVAPVITNFLYWHHGVFMGPRMLHEAAPAWLMLATAAAVGLVRLTPRRWDSFDAKAALSTAIIGSVVIGLFSGAGQRLSSYGGEWFEIMRLPVPPVESPALVFVHGGWTGRVAMSLASAGYRLDMIETLMRQNSTCDVHVLARHLLAGRHAAAAVALTELDTVPRNDRLPLTVEIAPGDRIRAWQGEQLTPECSREAASDRFGILDLSPLIWQGDLPGSEESGVMFVRDFGPEKNDALLRAHSDRTPFVYGIFEHDGDPVALPYDSAMSRLWGTARTDAIAEGVQARDDQFAQGRR
ncbi:MAG TPA: hypothetical protein VHG09_12635, partial [Longimicrobiales bacterium]|nr:hypothetical protein [Longimicrobiales bacterium]